MSIDTYTDKRWRRCLSGVGVAALAILSTACGSSTNTAGSTTPSTVVAQNVVGKRYCEVLLVHPSPTLLTATVYNTYPLNDCPEAKWAALDAASIAAANHVPFAELNGPRFWLMNSIAKSRHGHEVIKTFGGIAMIEEATVVLGTSVAGALVPYTPHIVSRQASFSFAAGSQIYELVEPGGSRWVMQTYSQIKDPTLSRADLRGLGGRLALPAGWIYQVRTLTKPLVVATQDRPAQVLQDNLSNSYSKETTG